MNINCTCQTIKKLIVVDLLITLWDDLYMETKKRTRGWRNFSISASKGKLISTCRHCKETITFVNKAYKGCCTAKCFALAGEEVITNTNRVEPVKYRCQKGNHYTNDPKTIFDAVHERKYRRQ